MREKEDKKIILTPVEELPTTHRRVLSMMPRGKDNPITITQIVQVLGGTYQATKEIIRELIIEHGYKIGTVNGSKSGHFLIENEDERFRTVKNFDSRMKEIEKRKRAILEGPLN
jgi:hypothetical protein